MRALLSICMFLASALTGLGQSAAAPTPTNVPVAKVPYLELQLKLSEIKLVEADYKDNQSQIELKTLRTEKITADYKRLNDELQVMLAKACGNVALKSCTPVPAPEPAPPVAKPTENK